jgi:hypothetical protein
MIRLCATLQSGLISVDRAPPFWRTVQRLLLQFETMGTVPVGGTTLHRWGVDNPNINRLAAIQKLDLLKV